jgi:hypothetical protein
MTGLADDHEQQGVCHGRGAQGCPARLRNVTKDQRRNLAEPSAGLRLASGGVPNEISESLKRERLTASANAVLDPRPRPLVKKRQQNRRSARHHQRAPIGCLDDLAQP